MSDFIAKMHQIVCRLGLQRSPEPLAGIKGSTSKGSGGETESAGRERSLYFLRGSSPMVAADIQ